MTLSTSSPWSRLAAAARSLPARVQADHAAVRAHRNKYAGDQLDAKDLPLDAVRKIGFQMMIAVRLMQSARDGHVPLAPELIARSIRHLYGAEIHWLAEIADGVSLVHGNGLVISQGAKIASGCILFQNVTLGMSTDPVTREHGAPTLQANVHVGPGATLLGPIVVGAGSKILAGATLTQTVPPNSVVRPADVIVQARRGPA